MLFRCDLAETTIIIIFYFQIRGSFVYSTVAYSIEDGPSDLKPNTANRSNQSPKSRKPGQSCTRARFPAMRIFFPSNIRQVVTGSTRTYNEKLMGLAGFYWASREPDCKVTEINRVPLWQSN